MMEPLEPTTDSAPATALVELTSTEPASPTLAPESANSPTSDAPLSSPLETIQATITVIAQRVDQTAKLLSTVTAQLTETNRQLVAAVELVEKLASEHDDQLDRLGVSVAALAQIEERLTRQLTPKKS